jgi:hypothetical protein
MMASLMMASLMMASAPLRRALRPGVPMSWAPKMTRKGRRAIFGAQLIDGRSALWLAGANDVSGSFGD